MAYFTHTVTDLGAARYRVDFYHKSFMDMPLATVEKHAGRAPSWTWRDEKLDTHESAGLADYIKFVRTEILD